MRSISIVSTLLLLKGTIGTQYPPRNYYPAPLRVGSAPPDGTATFISANAAANTSHTVDFTHAAADISNNASITGNWTWTVKVSDVYMANATNSSGTGDIAGIADPHVAYTTYEFTWPEAGDLDAALRDESNASAQTAPDASCGWLIDALFPASVSAAWDPDSSSCASALGGGCLQALSDLVGNATCSAPSLDLEDPMFMKACSGSFGAVNSVNNPFAVTPIAFGNASTSAANQSSLQKNQTFGYALSEVYSAGNTSAFAQQANNLHVLVLKSQKLNILCNRASVGSSTSGNSSSGNVPKNEASGFERNWMFTITASLSLALYLACL